MPAIELIDTKGTPPDDENGEARQAAPDLEEFLRALATRIDAYQPKEDGPEVSVQVTLSWHSAVLVQDQIHALMKDKAFFTDQIGRLADCILAAVPGEPSENEGAVDTAIRVIQTLLDQQRVQKPAAD